MEVYSGRMVETNNGKIIYSAMVKIATKHAQALLHNSGRIHRVSFKMTFEGNEWEADIKHRPQIEIPMDWSNDSAEAARLNTGPLVQKCGATAE